MHGIVKGAIECEKGNLLITVLILLFVGGLVLTPLLGLMSTGLVSGTVYERKMNDYYAADAGVEDAIWRIQGNNLTFSADNYSYPEPITVNERSVNVTIYRYDWDPTCGETFTYQILSTATSADGSSTTIDAYLSVSYMDLSALLDNAIVSQNTITIKPNNTVNGDIWLPDEEDLDVGNGVSINGTVKDEDDVSITWPTSEQLSSYYREDVEGAYDPGSFIDIKDLNPKTIGPWYREGSLAADNTGDPVTIVLEDTIYATGNLEFWQPAAGHNYTVDLNGQTIFAEGSISFASQHISVSGSGCIIAVGNVNFQPAITSGGDDFVLVMSITGQTYFHPSGNFTGCIVGNTHVQLQPGCTINWISPEGKGLDFPMGIGDINELPPVTGVRIVSWEIS